MNGRKALRTICASLAVALGLCALACFLPDNPYQRWQLVDDYDFGLFAPLRRAYERIHFDPQPIDVVVVGTSKTQLGVSAARIEQQLASHGAPANVENFSVATAGRNAEWAVVNEAFKTKSPKIVVVGIEGYQTRYGNPAFKFVASAAAIIAPPALLLHNYFYDLAYLPARQVKLFAARFLPDFFGLRDKFDPAIYAHTRSDFTSGLVPWESAMLDMERVVPPATLLSERLPAQHATLMERFLLWCCNDGDERVYLRAIAADAKAHGARLMFVFVPTYNFAGDIPDRDFVSRYGVLIDNRDLAGNSKLYESWSHLNHAGALANSDLIAAAISEMKTSSLDAPSIK